MIYVIKITNKITQNQILSIILLHIFFYNMLSYPVFYE